MGDTERGKVAFIAIPSEDDDEPVASPLRYSGSGLMDVMLVFPAARQDDDDKQLEDPGPDGDKPAAGSADWYLKKIILDDIIFTLNCGRQTMADAMNTQNSPKRRRSASGEEDGISHAKSVDDISGMMRAKSKEAMAGQADETDPWDAVEPIIINAYKKAKSAKTLGEFRKCVLDLVLRFLLCRHCGFQARSFASVDGEETFVGISASDPILRAHADKQKYKLQMSRKVAGDLLLEMFREDEISPPFVRFDVDDEESYSAKRDPEFDPSPFRVFYETYASGSIFHNSDRASIICASLSKVFDMPTMVSLGFLRSFYPLHNQKDLPHLSESWSKFHLDEGGWTKGFQPAVSLDDICLYFGAKVAFRTCFLRFVSKQLAPVAIVAVLLHFVDCGSWEPMIMGLILMLWAATAEEFWKRTEALFLLEWGMEDFCEQDAIRPQFSGTEDVNPVDRRTVVKVYPQYKHLARKVVTNIVTVIFNVFVIGSMLVLYNYHDRLLTRGHPRKALLVNVAIALMIQVFNTFWLWAAWQLTNFENHQTKQEYADGLVFRNFGTYFITSFFSVFYLAFLKGFLVGCGEADTCEGELAKQLITLFVINMCFHLLSVALPYATYRLQLKRQKWNRSSSSTVPDLSFPEAQAKMLEYTPTEEIYDRMDVWVELGYVLFFGLIVPDIILLFLVSNLMRVHALGWKLSYTMRRPLPDGSDGIGNTFRKIFKAMAQVAVGSNIVLLLINNASGTLPEEDLFNEFKAAVGTADHNVTRNQDWKLMLTVFLLVERGVSFWRSAIDSAIPDVPAEVQLQRKRRIVVQEELAKLTTAYERQWEGRELQRAYTEKTEEHRVQVLTKDHSWVMATAPSVAAGQSRTATTLVGQLLPWTFEDPDFEPCPSARAAITHKADDESYLKLSSETSRGS